jgi:hypothetical protein
MEVDTEVKSAGAAKRFEVKKVRSLSTARTKEEEGGQSLTLVRSSLSLVRRGWCCSGTQLRYGHGVSLIYARVGKGEGD